MDLWSGPIPEHFLDVPSPSKEKTVLSLKYLARVKCMTVEVPPVPSQTLNQLGLLWEKRGEIRIGRDFVLIEGERFFCEYALYIAASEGEEDSLLFFKNLIEYQGGSCWLPLLLAADAGNLKAVRLCWKHGVRSQVHRAVTAAAYRKNGDVVDFFLGAEEDKVPHLTVFQNYIDSTSYARECSLAEACVHAGDILRSAAPTLEKLGKNVRPKHRQLLAGVWYTPELRFLKMADLFVRGPFRSYVFVLGDHTVLRFCSAVGQEFMNRVRQ